MRKELFVGVELERELELELFVGMERSEWNWDLKRKELFGVELEREEVMSPGET